ncbi:GTP pyrophosphokinase ywaC [Exiguobacterium sp. S17]|nr:GTP pyrophosphokinase ywaC [Exiguobacterium sp. S17]
MDIEEFFGEQFHQWREQFRYYEMAITELESDLGIIDLDWQTRLGYSPIEHVKTRMKTLPSIIRKMNQNSFHSKWERYGTIFMTSPAYGSSRVSAMTSTRFSII